MPEHPIDWTTRVRGAFAATTRPPDNDIVEELAQHAQAEYERARAEGLTSAGASAHVDELLGGWVARADALRRRPRRPSVVQPPPEGGASWSGTWRDAAYAARLLRRDPRYAALAILTMAVGIGASTLLFTLTYGVLGKPLPWPAAERLVVLKETRGGNPPRFRAFSNATYLAWKDGTVTLDALGAWSPGSATLTGAGDAERLRVTHASASFFRVLQARPLIGSLFDDKDEGAALVVLSESLWRQRFAGDAAAIGRSAMLDGEPHTIVGVLPDRIAFPDRQSRAWIPFRVRPAVNNWLSMFNAVGRLRPGVTPTQAAAEGTARGRFAPDTGMTTMAVFGSTGAVGVTAESLDRALTGEVRRPLMMLLAAVALLLCAATANVAGLQLARATTRQREMALRTALGASSRRVTRQLLVESLLVSLIGGAVGSLLAFVLHRYAAVILPADFPRVNDLRFDAVPVLFASLLALTTGVAAGLLPALRLSRIDLTSALSEDAGAPAGASGRSFSSRARATIMAGQVAIACVLLIGAVLLSRSFVSLLESDRGYDPSGLLTARVAFTGATYSAQDRRQMVGAIMNRLASVPGVEEAAFTSELPLGPGGSTAAFSMRGANGEMVSIQASPRVVSPRYFAAMRMRVTQGRGFEPADGPSDPPVVVVNRAFATKYLGSSPLGATMPMGVGFEEGREGTVVGVIDDVRYLTSADTTQPEMYYSYLQLKGGLPVPGVSLLLRTVDDPSSLAGAVRTAVNQTHSSLVAESVLGMEERVLVGLARPRLYAFVLAGFALAALAVAAVGLLGVLSYSLAQRSRELAVRAALGARPLDLVRLVVSQTLLFTGAGIIVGVASALVASRSIAALLHGVAPYDAATFIGVPLALLAVVIAVSVPPALRAARLDPLRALKS